MERLAPMPLAPQAAVSTEVVVALLGAAATVLAAVIGAWLARRNDAANARLSYNYEARKRLYAVCEPHLFQATEQAEEACARILGLARAARRDHIGVDGAGWLDLPDNYYFQSTVYSLLAPITTFSILQRQMTTIDLGLDADVRAKYEMLKLIFFSFKDDWNLAEGDGGTTRLPYDRNRTDPGEPGQHKLLRDSPRKHAPQGLYRVMIYVVAEALVAGADGAGTTGAANADRCITFGEFQRAWNQARAERARFLPKTVGRLLPHRPQSPLTPVFDTLVELFSGFHPWRKPVLWRLLLAQYLLYRALLSERPEVQTLTELEAGALMWSTDPGDEKECHQALETAASFVEQRLASLRRNLKQG